MKVLNRVLLVSSVFFASVYFAVASPVGLIPANASWRYLSDGTDPGAGWNTLGFNDSAWPVGPAQLGYGEGDETTVVNTSVQRPVTVYFRRGVLMPGGTDLILRLLRDDGAVVYFNGVEVRRDNLPAGPINSQTLAIAAVGGTDESTFFETTIPASAVAPGTNIIAVEVHQSSVNSGDLSFALELIANFPPPFSLVTVTAIDSEAREIPPWLDIPENPAVFQVRRTGNTNSSLNVVVQFSGTASNGVDYETIPGTVTIPAGSVTANVIVHAIDDSLVEGTETVRLSIIPPPPIFCPECNYIPGTNSTATAFILDNDETNAPPTVWIHRPQEGSTFTTPTNILLIAVAHDPEDGDDITVEFFEGTNKIGNATFIPSLCPSVDCPSWYLEWSNVPPGNYSLTAKATDKTGLMTVSAPVHISVIATNPPPPTNSLVLRFEPPSLPGGSRLISNWVENGFFFSTPNRMGHSDNGVSDSSPSNGTAFLQFGANQSPLTIVNLNGQPFSLLSIDFAEYSTVFATQKIISVGGYRADGSAVTTLVHLDGIIDGSGPQMDFQTFTFGPLFSGLTRVEVSPSPYSLDNVRVAVNGTNPPPERTIISVVATDSQAREPGVLTVIDAGQFAVRRAGNLGFSVSVSFVLSGTAANGVDYAYLSNRVVIPAGATQALVNVMPLMDNVAEGTETVVLTLESPVCIAIAPPPPECYLVGSPSQATVFIADRSTGTNQPPFVQINQPQEGEVFVAPASIHLQAYAQDPEDGYGYNSGSNGPSLRVEFFEGTNRIGVGTFVPTLCPAPYCPFYALTWSNVPPGNYTLRAKATDSAGAMTMSAPVHITVVSDNSGSNRVLVSMGSVWKYNDQCVDLGTAWRGLSYNDSAWASGPAQLGYGDGDEATVISSGPDPNSRCVTAYFRRSFIVSNAASISQLSGRLLQDDGGVVYLNGVEIFRSNLPPGDISPNTLATVAAENQIVDFTAPANLLVNGLNVIAVEMHQVAATSSDLSFDLELIGSGGPQPPERTVVSVAATDSQASESGVLAIVNPGQFAIRRTGNLAFSVPVSFVLSGSASNGADYAFISYRIVIPAGSTQALVNVLPLNDNAAEGTETVVLTLESPVCVAIAPPPPECYLVGSPNQATVFIGDTPSGTNRPPFAAFVAPPNGSVFTQGMSILLRASAFDVDGSVTRVEFRRGNLPIGLATMPAATNYTFLWSNPPVGSHTLFAIAVDNLNARGTSAPINVTVLSPSTNVPPPTNVTFTLAFNNRDGTEGVFFRQYTLDGPVNGGRLLPAMRVVPDDSGQWYYGAEQHQVWRVNLTSGQVQFMQIPANLPELSWPVGAAFDRIRNRVLVGTLGGEGHLYAYATSNGQWSLVNDLDNHDLDSIVHHAADDFIYGFEGGYGGTPRLVKLDADGNYVSEIPLPQQQFSITGHTSSSELVSLGEYLVLLIEPNPNWYNQPGLESRIYLINPRTGVVRLTYSRVVPPDSDRDGVPDADDQCPDTPLFALVDEHGCSVQQRDSDHDGVPDGRDQCPNTPAGVPVDENGCSPAQRDSDGDGVPNDRDECPNTPQGAVVNEQGCSIHQLCPCDGDWRNHHDYVRCVEEHAAEFYRAGLITREQRLQIVREAIKSRCGHRRPKLEVPPQQGNDIRANGYRLTLNSGSLTNCVVECSTNLVDWVPIQTLTLTGTQIQIVDPGARSASARFYRLRCN